MVVLEEHIHQNRQGYVQGGEDFSGKLQPRVHVIQIINYTRGIKRDEQEQKKRIQQIKGAVVRCGCVVVGRFVGGIGADRL